ncbi:DEAD/DEAH box helicase [Methylobacillus flagellatus]|uniref:ATP-dependent RNA helicase RhlE n=2 Tax=root TaxID=1 RepID=Q1H2C1_METFK|nr:DEAD/DEAH box helicase [Methylobacillus flagellatus]ABE49222.1 DEAD/DEAH box helicase-like protein [Methylobacillus flagellatus KT]ABE49366.1 DEAD/DEAH box helicase-like protein [Methylobacillus flagellatus KT]ABZ07182.1 putative DEAD/DEAH box helicase [uncultured marine microorganism HF4000_ANIW133B20]
MSTDVSITLSNLQFSDLGLAEPILRAIADTGYTHPTPIQAQAIPLVLNGGDLLAGAQTGTGKTAGFTLPVLHLLHAKPVKVKPGQPRCLILTPTRELAAQVEESVQTYGKHLKLTSMVMFGGVGINPQIERLKKPLDILVATPGRLLDHAAQKTIDLSAIEILVLDEADRMLDMGFIRDIKRVLALLPKKRQNLLFSATFSDEIKELADGLLHNPGFVEVARRNTASELVEQAVHLVSQGHKRDLVAHLIRHHDWKQVLIFTRTKHGANRLAEKLSKDGIAAAAIHGNKSQSARTKALAEFKNGTLPVLVATDIAARGLDIDQLPQVVNFELPNVPEDYVHRIGRTGRAGCSGAAVSLVDGEEIKLLKGIERLIKREIPRLDIPGAFVPSDKPGVESRPPRQQPAQARQTKSNRPQAQRERSDAAGNSAEPRSGNKPRQGRNHQAKAQGQPQPQAQRSKPQGQGQAVQAKKKPEPLLSEAARHQAMPQVGLFVPPQPPKRQFHNTSGQRPNRGRR